MESNNKEYPKTKEEWLALINETDTVIVSPANRATMIHRILVNNKVASYDALCYALTMIPVLMPVLLEYKQSKELCLDLGKLIRDLHYIHKMYSQAE